MKKTRQQIENEMARDLKALQAMQLSILGRHDMSIDTNGNDFLTAAVFVRSGNELARDENGNLRTMRIYLYYSWGYNRKEMDASLELIQEYINNLEK